MKPALLAIAFASASLAQVTFPSLNSSPWLGQEMLGRVEPNSVTVNVAFDQNMQVYFEYGTASGVYTSRTATQTATANTPLNVVLSDLQPNTRYYYRMQYAAGSAFTARPEHTFVTQRPRGTPFTFVLQADPHMDNNSTSAVYQLTLANELADKPDFMIDLGDTMLTDKLDAEGIPVSGGASPTAPGVLARAQMHRSYYDLAAHSIPLFLVVGNHEGEWGSNLNGTPQDMAIWDTEDRTAYFPTPAPDSFFSGDTQFYDLTGNLCIPGQSVTCGLGQRRSYYSWEWGDALFVVLDPFWSQTPDASTNLAGNGQDCCQKNAGYWSLTLGPVQYNWLQQTLENSSATYKFVFAHNLVGGTDMVVDGTDEGPMRGGVESAKYLEWGGYNLDGTWGFSTYRPDMPMPIHQLLVANHVNAFFHGHDHLYAHQQLDGITYQEVPQPSATNASLGTRASDYGYVQGTLLGGRGYLRVQVSPTGVNVQYVETWLPSEQGTNGAVADSYTISPIASPRPSISAVANAASQATIISPNTWVEIKGANLAPDTRSWQAADFVDNQLPTQLDGVSATVNGQAAYISYISPSQINILTPPAAVSGTAPVQVTVNGQAGAVFSAQAQAASPSFFLFSSGPYVAATHLDGTLVGPAALYPGSSTPANPGETIVLYGNGFGPTSTPVVSGSTGQSGSLSPTPSISIGGAQAAVQFAGLVSPGLFQFNVTVPPGTSAGDQPVVATYDGQSTPAGMVSISQQF